MNRLAEWGPVPPWLRQRVIEYYEHGSRGVSALEQENGTESRLRMRFIASRASLAVEMARVSGHRHD